MSGLRRSKPRVRARLRLVRTPIKRQRHGTSASPQHAPDLDRHQPDRHCAHRDDRPFVTLALRWDPHVSYGSLQPNTLVQSPRGTTAYLNSNHHASTAGTTGGATGQGSEYQWRWSAGPTRAFGQCAQCRAGTRGRRREAPGARGNGAGAGLAPGGGHSGKSGMDSSGLSPPDRGSHRLAPGAAAMIDGSLIRCAKIGQIDVNTVL
jgi:hypothetical protein